MKPFYLLIFCTLLSSVIFAQKSNVQAAWRALSDYEATMIEAPDLNYLTTANDKIKPALTHETTGKQYKTFVYKFLIDYYFHKYYFNLEQKKGGELELAYNNVNSDYILSSAENLGKLYDLEPTYIPKLLQQAKDQSYLSEDEIKIINAVNSIYNELNNFSVSKYKANNYIDASNIYFNIGIYKQKTQNLLDSTSFQNALICAQKANDNKKIVFYALNLIEKKIAKNTTYIGLTNAYLDLKDTANALLTLKQSVKLYSNDYFLLNKYITLSTAKNKNDELLRELETSYNNSPNNKFLNVAIGDLYYSKISNITSESATVVPAYEAQFTKAETYYLNASKIKVDNEDINHITNYNLGVLYYNFGALLYNLSITKSVKVKPTAQQIEFEKRSSVLYQKAIPFFEAALTIHTDDTNSMLALQKLYYLVNNQPKGIEMTNKLKVYQKK